MIWILIMLGAVIVALIPFAVALLFVRLLSRHDDREM